MATSFVKIPVSLCFVSVIGQKCGVPINLLDNMLDINQSGPVREVGKFIKSNQRIKLLLCLVLYFRVKNHVENKDYTCSPCLKATLLTFKNQLLWR